MELLGNILVLLLMAAFVASAARVFHHAIGSPRIKDDGGIGYESNRIFGNYGRWLVVNQVRFMNKEYNEQQEAFKQMNEEGFLAKLDELKQQEKERSGKENRAADYSHAHLKKYYSPDPIEVTKVNTKGKVSIWLPLGMCLICFATWVGLLSFAIILPSFGFSLWWLPLMAATSTMIAARI